MSDRAAEWFARGALPGKLTLRISEEDPGCVVVQCEEYDIAAQGDDLGYALGAFGEVIHAQIMIDVLSGRAPLSGVPSLSDRSRHE